MSGESAEHLHERHFTRDEANAMLPRLRPLLERLRDARDDLTDAEAHELLSGAAPTNGGGDPGRQVGEAFLAVREILGVIESAGVVLKDIERGLVDFPAILEGREVYLCWELGEDGVDHWHEIEAGFNGRQPLD